MNKQLWTYVQKLLTKINAMVIEWENAAVNSERSRFKDKLYAVKAVLKLEHAKQTYGIENYAAFKKTKKI